MKKLMSATDAKRLVSGSEERKNELIELTNKEIEFQSKGGNRWCHLPITASDEEKQWLKDELTLNGFTIKESNPAVNW